MTCRECEMALGLDDPVAEIEDHLRGCAGCRALAADVRANAEAFQSMAFEKFERLRIPVARPVLPAAAALAAAAMLLIAFAVSLQLREQKLPAVHYALAPMKFEIPPPAPQPRRRRARPARPLMVKMLTADPNVVIYWQIDAEQEGMEK